MNIDSFTAAYSPPDRSRIAFESNGLKGPELRDRNVHFRRHVIAAIIETPVIATDQLIRDLYDAETQYSQSSFSVHHPSVAALAQELLTRGGDENLSHYLRCVDRAFDSYMSSQCVTLNRRDAVAAIGYIDKKIAELGEDAPEHYSRVRGNIERRNLA
ncbi:hypothetical protein [Alienimonas chondri]|uniref:hypothetical protein n=1 Tax=Alienimonas chondri TaxID=2681879 RepID=UPI0014891B30|nr:hypothetical protein [Alienimonas chondri]